MKTAIIQLPYSVNYTDSECIYQTEVELLNRCDESLDLIVLPESCDVPALPETLEERTRSHEIYTEKLLNLAKATAKRCRATLFINLFLDNDQGGRNTTFVINKEGEVAGHYFKQHLTPGESDEYLMDDDYTFEFSEPTVIEVDGIRYAFLTCYDFYFYENFANIARQNVDIVIGCSHQRSDSDQMSEILTRFCAFNCNAHVLRSTVTFGEDSPAGGSSMVVTPDGTVLVNMHNKVGMAVVDIDPKNKFYKPAGFGNPPAAHYEYIEQGRRPWKYRPAGSAIARHDAIMQYPRVCAHRGFNTVAPENSMPAFGAAVAMGADEIEFDLWVTRDGEIVSIHDPVLDRVSDGSGKVWEHSYEELLKYDFGKKFSPEYEGLRILKFEDILKKFSCHAVMNIHLKTVDNKVAFDEAALLKIIGLIEKYDCVKYVYFMSGNDTVQAQLKRLAPHILRCQGAGDEPKTIVERAIENGCQKLQFWRSCMNKEMIDKAHAHGIRCNVFWSDDPEEARRFIEMGIDTILTNDYNRIANEIKNK